jgi:ABC-2 type transport system permease protein
MSLILRGEWTKLRTLPGTGWLLLGVVVVTVAVSAATSAALSCTSSAACHPDITKLSFSGTQLGQAIVAIVGALAITSEYSTGMIRTTLAAAPRRTVMLAAKAAVVAALALAAGAVAILGLLYIFPILGLVVASPGWQRHLQQIGPQIQASIGVRTLPISPWAGLGVLTAWATAALLAGGALLRLRDA